MVVSGYHFPLADSSPQGPSGTARGRAVLCTKHALGRGEGGGGWFQQHREYRGTVLPRLVDSFEAPLYVSVLACMYNAAWYLLRTVVSDVVTAVLAPGSSSGAATLRLLFWFSVMQ